MPKQLTLEQIKRGWGEEIAFVEERYREGQARRKECGTRTSFSERRTYPLENLSEKTFYLPQKSNYRFA